MNEGKVTYGNVPNDVAAQFEGLLVGHGLSYEMGYQFLRLLAETWPERRAVKEYPTEDFASAAFRADRAENTIKNARMQLAALLKQPVEVYEELSLGGMINCLATKVAFPHPEDLPPKLQEQFGAQGPAVFVIDANGPDTCEEAIKLFLGAHKGFYTAKYIVEMLKTIYNSRWTRGCILRELTRLSNTKKIYRAIRPGKCSVYRAIEKQH